VRFGDVIVMVSVALRFAVLGNFDGDVNGRTSRMRANYLGESHFGKPSGSASHSAGSSC
jgi:hypothetical protein